MYISTFRRLRLIYFCQPNEHTNRKPKNTYTFSLKKNKTSTWQNSCPLIISSIALLFQRQVGNKAHGQTFVTMRHSLLVIEEGKAQLRMIKGQARSKVSISLKNNANRNKSFPLADLCMLYHMLSIQFSQKIQ